MPPFYPQAPLDALGAAGLPRWVEVALAALAVAGEPWVLGLLAIALYSWLEREVAGVLKAVAPLLVALAAAGGVAVAARAAWAAPRALGAGEGLAPVLHDLLPGAHVLSLSTFAVYSLLAYGRRALPALALLAAAVGARLHGGPHWVDLAGGGAAGAALGGVTYLVALRAFPGGHLARLRVARRQVPARSP